MALQFCSNSLLLKSTVQLFRVITEIKIGREKNKRYHLTYKVEKQKGMRSHTKCTLSSYNFSPRAFCLFTVLRDKQIQSSLPQNTNTHIQEINNQETPTCIQVNTQTPTNNHTHSKRVKNKKTNLCLWNMENHINSVPNHTHLCCVPFIKFIFFSSQTTIIIRGGANT